MFRPIVGSVHHVTTLDIKRNTFVYANPFCFSDLPNIFSVCTFKHYIRHYAYLWEMMKLESMHKFDLKFVILYSYKCDAGIILELQLTLGALYETIFEAIVLRPRPFFFVCYVISATKFLAKF